MSRAPADPCDGRCASGRAAWAGSRSGGERPLVWSAAAPAPGALGSGCAWVWPKPALGPDRGVLGRLSRRPFGLGRGPRVGGDGGGRPPQPAAGPHRRAGHDRRGDPGRALPGGRDRRRRASAGRGGYDHGGATGCQARLLARAPGRRSWGSALSGGGGHGAQRAGALDAWRPGERRLADRGHARADDLAGVGAGGAAFLVRAAAHDPGRLDPLGGPLDRRAWCRRRGKGRPTNRWW